MVEPTESEDLGEIDRFCDAMIAIRAEIDRVAAGEWSVEGSPLRGAPHTSRALVGEWDRAYSREEAVFPDRGRSRQVLAAGGPHRPGLRRPQPGLRLPASGGVRRVSLHRAAGAAAGRRSAAVDRRRACCAPVRSVETASVVGAVSGPLSHRVDHQDDHGGDGAAAARRGALSLDDPVGSLRAGDRLRRRDGAVAALAHVRACRASRPGPGGSGPRRRLRDAGGGQRRRGAVAAAGEYFHYTNLGFALLGEAVSRLRGDSWWQVASTRVLAPLAMLQTTYRRPPRRPGRPGVERRPLRGHAHPRAAPGHAGDGTGGPALEHGLRPGAVRAVPRAGPPRRVVASTTLREMSRAPRARLRAGPRCSRQGGRRLVGHGGTMPGFLASMFDRSGVGRRDGGTRQRHYRAELPTGVPAVLLGGAPGAARRPWVPTERRA